MRSGPAIKSLLFLMMTAGAVMACSNPDFSNVTVHVSDHAIAPESVDDPPFIPSLSTELAIDQEGTTYLIERISAGHSARPSTYAIRRKQTDGKWDRVVEFREGERASGLRIRPGTSEIYYQSCHYPDRLGLAPHDFKLFRITPGAESFEITSQVLGDLSTAMLMEIGIADCSATWIVEQDGSFVFGSANSLWRLRDGNAESILDNLNSVVMAPPACDLGRLGLSVNEQNEILVFITGLWFSDRCRDTDFDKLERRIFQLTGDRLELVASMSKDINIGHAVIGPDSAIYLIGSEVQEDGTSAQHLRLGGGQRSSFADITPHTIGSLSFDSRGKLHLIYEVQPRPLRVSGDGRWILVFPTDRVFSELSE